MTNFPIHPKYPERICWGCEKLCPLGDLRCGNGTVRTQHPAELFGDDWFEWLMEKEKATAGNSGGREDNRIDSQDTGASPAPSD